MTTTNNWFIWAVLSAVFAAFTAIFSKIGIQGVNSDLATLVRTVVVVFILTVFVWVTGNLNNPLLLPPKTWLFLILSALSTGASWVCYFRALQVGETSKVAAVDKFSLALVAVFAFTFLGERLSLQGWLGVVLVSLGLLVLTIK